MLMSIVCRRPSGRLRIGSPLFIRLRVAPAFMARLPPSIGISAR